MLINKTILLIMTLMLTLLNSSCGLKGPTAPSTVRSAFSVQELQCDESRSFKTTQSYLAIKKRIDEIDTFLNLYNKHPERETNRIFRPMLGLASQQTSPSEPMILGEKENQAQLSELDQAWINAIGEVTWFSFLANQKAELNLQVQEVHIDEKVVNALLRNFNRLLENASRWNYLQCNLNKLSEKKKSDIRSYLQYKKFVENSCLNNGSCTEEEFLLSKDAQDELIQLCMATNSSYICKLELEQHQRLKTLKEFEKYYLDKEKDKFNSFFEIKVLNKWSCHDRFGKTIVEVPYYLDDKFLKRIENNTDLFESFVERRWGEGDIQVKLIHSAKPDENTVTVNWVQSTVSFVNYDRPKVINLSDELSYKNLMLVFSHELGHVLGFPDCYLEFYEKKEKRSVYYDLDFDADNLMCDTHFGATAPESYLNQIKSSACKD